MKKLIAYLLLFGSIAFLILVILIKLIPIFTSAYMSLKFDCSDKSISELQNETKSLVIGVFSIENNTQKITVNEEYKEAMPHELCHKNQYEQNRLFSCENKIMLFVNELECYAKQSI